MRFSIKFHRSSEFIEHAGYLQALYKNYFKNVTVPKIKESDNSSCNSICFGSNFNLIF
ncbi:hypothetical protein D1AOALGA4SA_12316 [Olavius algarvensis Delta 1 endosymbiont]|nr:hypothetical protein D1AOALGA4SA_12316 [Olavius algarvensis Delta 1 endosymbiont]